MNERISRRIAVLLAVLGLGGLITILVILVAAPETAQAVVTPAGAGMPQSLPAGRGLEPVVVVGADLDGLAGVPAEQLFVYSYADADWTQIPAQIDEVTATGAYTSTEDGLLDANDELVFMTMDMGDRAPAGGFLTGTLPISDTWYEIEVTDPTSPGDGAWAYLVRSTVLTSTVISDYVGFDDLEHRINAGRYSLGMATTHAGFDYLALGGSGVDVVDRTKMRLQGAIPFLAPLTEDSLGPQPHDLVVDGPVRVILREGKVVGYESLVRWSVAVDKLPPLYRSHFRYSTDFTDTITGSLLYNAAVPGGVTVDGITDTVPAEPFSAWWQLSTGHGTVVQVGDTGPLGGVPTNYYRDNLIWDPEDTGDQRSYGDVGITIDDPNLTFTYTFALYSLEGTQPNVGPVYEAYFAQPLASATYRDGVRVTLEAMPESLTVGETAVLTATVVDRLDQAISGVEVAFALVSGPGAVSPPVATTDENGQAVTSLSSLEIGTAVLRATASGQDSNTQAVTFTPAEVGTVELEADPDRLYAGATADLVATVTDLHGNPIGGQDVAFAIVSGDGSVTPPIATTDETGQALASLTSQVVGTAVIQATAGGVESNGQAVTFLRAVYLPLLARDAGALPMPYGSGDFGYAATQGFGDRQNSAAWSMAWWEGNLYVGTARAYACLQAIVQNYYLPFVPYPPNDPEILCPGDGIEDLPLRSEIWRWSPETDQWSRVFRSPASFEVPGQPGVFVPLDAGIRGMATFTETDGTKALYAVSYTTRDIILEAPYPRLLRSVDGLSFEPVPQDPGTFLGDLDNQVEVEGQDRIQGFRSMETFDGRLYVVAGGLYGDGAVIESTNPQLGNDSFRQITDPEVKVVSLFDHDGYLWIGTGTNPKIPGPGEPGYTLYKTTATGPVPYELTPVVTDGGCRPDSKTVVYMEAFRGRLYAGTNQPAELIRVNPDDTWDLIMGDPRTCPDGIELTPLSGFGDGFDFRWNIHVHRMRTHEGVLYVGMNDHSTELRDNPLIAPLVGDRYGFDLYATNNGNYYSPITIRGFIDHPESDGAFSESARTFASTPYGLFLGTQNSYHGLEMWRAERIEAPGGSPGRLESEILADGTVLLSWEPAAGAQIYRIWRSTFTSNQELGIDGLEADSWIPDRFAEVGATEQSWFADEAVDTSRHFYHYYVVAEDGKGVESEPSNLVRAPSLAPAVTFDRLIETLDNWARRAGAVEGSQPGVDGTLLSSLDTAHSALESGDPDGALAQLDQIRQAIRGGGLTGLPEWRLADLEVLVTKLARRVRLVDAGLLPAEGLD